MLNIEINGTAYRVPETCADITLDTHLQMLEVEASAPEEWRDLSEERDPNKRRVKISRFPKNTYVRKVLPYFARVVAVQTGIPVEVMLNKNGHTGCPVSLIERIYWQIQAAYFAFNPQTDARLEFEIEGGRWVLPPEEMRGETFGRFAQAAQFEEYAADVAGGNWQKMPHVMAVLLTPEGETFDPDVFDTIENKRVAIMLRQPMSVVYSVAFFLTELKRRSVVDSVIYTAARTLGRYRRV